MAKYGDIPSNIDIPAGGIIRRDNADTSFEAKVIKSQIIEVDFGATEDSYVKTTISDTNILSTSIITVSPAGITTTDHDPDDYQWDRVSAYATNIVNGVSFDIIATAEISTWGKYKFNVIYF